MSLGKKVKINKSQCVPPAYQWIIGQGCFETKDNDQNLKTDIVFSKKSLSQSFTDKEMRIKKKIDNYLSSSKDDLLMILDDTLQKKIPEGGILMLDYLLNHLLKNNMISDYVVVGTEIKDLLNSNYFKIAIQNGKIIDVFNYIFNPDNNVFDIDFFLRQIKKYSKINKSYSYIKKDIYNLYFKSIEDRIQSYKGSTIDTIEETTDFYYEDLSNIVKDIDILQEEGYPLIHKLLEHLLINNMFDDYYFFGNELITNVKNQKYIEIAYKTGKLMEYWKYLNTKKFESVGLESHVKKSYLADILTHGLEYKDVLDEIADKYPTIKLNEELYLNYMEEEPWGEDPDNSIKKYIDTHFKPNMRPRHILEDNSYCEYKKSKDNKPISFDDIPLPIIKAQFKVEIPMLKYGFTSHNFKKEYLENFPEPEFHNAEFIIDRNNRVGSISNVFESLSTTFKFPLEWFNECNKYISELSLVDKFKLLSYTFNGDKIANSFLINTENFEEYINENIYNKSEIKNKKHKYEELYFPLFMNSREYIIDEYEKKYSNIQKYLSESINLTDIIPILDKIAQSEMIECYNTLINNFNIFNMDFYKHISSLYIKDLKKIINNSPALPSEAILYRGTTDKYYRTDSNSDYFYSSAFMSTSCNLNVAFNFTNDITECCIKKIIVPSGTRCVFMEMITSVPSEIEILLAPDNEFKIIEDKIVEYNNSEFDSSFDETLCKNKISKINITTMKLNL